ncbi:hypothetical protein [Pseudomonas sp.]|uniref:hypothetical protein n=1 Tax=Pseudomonas sp. TaxID=306 RepID=UPI002897A7B4|nr:hypothetical protein [Pseudomonas sp.]
MDFSKFSPFGSSDLEGDYGIPLHYFLAHFNESFKQSGGTILDAYLKEFDYVTKWLLVSDYAFYDKNKKHDIVTFSLIPYIASFERMRDVLGGLAPADLKKIRKVKKEFIHFLASGPVFNINIKLDRDRKLHTDERLYHRRKIEMLIAQLEHWAKTTPAGIDNYKRQIKMLRNLDLIVNSSGGNLKAIRDIEIVSSLAAYLMSEVTSRTNVEVIGWFSDRDALLNFKAAKLGNLIFEMVDLYYYALCYNLNESSKADLIIGLPEEKNSVWYDTLIRIPDLLAGTFADFDYENNVLSHDKFVSVVDGLFLAEKRNLFYNINFGDKLSAGRMMWGLRHDG